MANGREVAFFTDAIQVPLAPCFGIMAVAPDPVVGQPGVTVPGVQSSRPPGPFGGNMDVKQMTAGSKLLLPVGIDGALFSTGDAHFAQGDGEVSGTAIEMGARVTVRTAIRKGQGAFIKWPHFEGGAQLKAIEPSSFYATTGVPVKKPGFVPPPHQYLSDKIIDLGQLNEDLTMAARNALIDIIERHSEPRTMTPDRTLYTAEDGTWRLMRRAVRGREPIIVKQEEGDMGGYEDAPGLTRVDLEEAMLYVA